MRVSHELGKKEFRKQVYVSSEKLGVKGLDLMQFILNCKFTLPKRPKCSKDMRNVERRKETPSKLRNDETLS